MRERAAAAHPYSFSRKHAGRAAADCRKNAWGVLSPSLSFLRVIAEKATETGFDLKNGPVKKAVCIGEPIRDRSFALNASGRAIEAAWGARIFSTYGVTELANSVCECLSRAALT